jgi:uncharacterized protein YbaR (Trm112 family)
MSVDPKLVEILACPKCKGPLEHREGAHEGFACRECELFYAVEDGIPNFLVDEATSLSEQESS